MVWQHTFLTQTTPASIQCKMADTVATADAAKTKEEAKSCQDAIAAPSIQDGEIMGEKIAIDTVEAEHEYTAAEFRRLLWKIDLCLLPVMWFCYGTQQADKTATSVMSVFGIQTDTGLKGQQFSWLTTIFYVLALLTDHISSKADTYG